MQFDVVRTAQARLRDSDNPFISYELALMEGIQHLLDFEPARQSRSIQSFSESPRYTPDFYFNLRALLAQPDVRGISFTYGSDFEVVRLMIGEKLRRDGIGASLQAGFQVAMVGDMPEDFNCAWLSLMHWYSEGLLRTGTLVFGGSEDRLAYILERAPGEEWRRILVPRTLARPDPHYQWTTGNGWSLGISTVS